MSLFRDAVQDEDDNHRRKLLTRKNNGPKNKYKFQTPPLQ